MPTKRFNIHVSDEFLMDLKTRLNHVRWPSQVNNLLWDRGTDLEYLQALVSYWRDNFDWRIQETELNQLNHYKSVIDGVNIHFVHERGKGPNPLPIILTHGWPDSFIRYKKIIPLLTDPVRHNADAEDSFDVIVPSIPGFGFSSLSEQSVLNNHLISILWARLMTEELGYKKFVAGGGDMGSSITRYLSMNHPELLYGIHLTDIGIIRPLLTPQDLSVLTKEELEYRNNAQDWIAKEGAYMSIQSTKPQTIAYGLSDSPVGLAGWIIEKFRNWSDCDGDLQRRFTFDELLTNIMIYWISNTIGSAAHVYYENTHSLPPLNKRIETPTGIALLASDVLKPPKVWAEKQYNITRWTNLPRGGHFTAMEEPELLAEEIRAFCRPFREKGTQIIP